MTITRHDDLVEYLRRELRLVNDEIPELLPGDARLIADIGVDSLDLIEFVASVEYEYEFIVPDEDWPDLETLDQIAGYIASHLPADE